MAGDHRAAFRTGLAIGAVDLHGGPVIARLGPLGVHILVVVRGGAVNVPLHGPGENILVLKAHLPEQAGGFAELILKLGSADSNKPAALADLHRLFGQGGQGRSLLTEQNLVEAQLVASGKEGSVVPGLIEEGNSGKAGAGQAGHRDLRLAVGGDGGHFQISARHDLAIGHGLIAQGGKVLGVGEVPVVVEDENALFALRLAGADGPDHVFKLL